MDYKDVYLRLFNAVTDALEDLARNDIQAAKARLIAAQQMCEDMYIAKEGL